MNLRSKMLIWQLNGRGHVPFFLGKQKRSFPPRGSTNGTWPRLGQISRLLGPLLLLLLLFTVAAEPRFFVVGTTGITTFGGGGGGGGGVGLEILS